MPGPRQTLAVLEGNGKKHLSQKEKAERRDSEVTVDSSGPVDPPDWLKGKALQERFRCLEQELRSVLPFCALDADCLAHFLIAQDRWEKAGAQAKKALGGKKLNVEAAKDWSSIEDRYFKQARACANDLGLTITSRCRMVVPQAKPSTDENPFERMKREREARRNA